MVGQGPLVKLYGVADAVLQEEDSLEPARRALLARWLPLNAAEGGAGWYNNAVEMFGGDGPRIEPGETGTQLDVTEQALNEIIADPSLPANRRLHALTAVMRALPERFEDGGEFREHAQQIMGQLEFIDDAVDLYIFGGPSGLNELSEIRGISHVEEWEALLELANHQGFDALLYAQLQDSPCNDDWYISPPGDAVAVMSTSYDVAATLEDACSWFLNPANWPSCHHHVWKSMQLCPAGQTSMGPDGVARTYREVVQADAFDITTCLQFVMTKNDYSALGAPSNAVLSYSLCDNGVDEACWHDGAAPPAPHEHVLMIDEGSILVKEILGSPNMLKVETSKSLRFRPPFNGLGLASLACAAGYGPQGKIMATHCSKPPGTDTPNPESQQPQDEESSS